MQHIKGSEMNMKKEEISWSDVSAVFREIFPKERPMQWKLVHLIFHNHLSAKGDIKRTVEICLESNIDALGEYEWRIPLPKPQQNRVHGLSVHDGHGEILEHELTYYKKTRELDTEKPDYALIKILFPSLGKGQRITIRLEYFVENYANVIKRGIFSKLWKYPWSYRVLSETRKFEYRVILPVHCRLMKNGVVSNMPVPPLNFTYGEKEMTIWMADNPSPGDLSGEVIYSQEAPTGPMVISLASGVFISAVVSLIIGGLSLLPAIGVFAASFVGVLGTLYLAKKLLPTYE